MNLKFTGLAAVVKSLAQHVARARRGNMAMIFAIVLVPVLITGGAGIDLARAMAVRTKLYAAVDAAALAVASKNGINQSQAEVLAQQYFNANYKLNSTFGTPANVTVNLVGQSVTVSTNNNMPTTLMGIAGFQNVNLTASSNVVWGQTKIWVGLALDNTGSMCQTNSNPNLSSCPTPAADSKIAALKTATHALLAKFQSVAANAGDVRVSLVPFAKTVNVGSSKYAETWIDFSTWDTASSGGASHGTCTVNGSINSSITTKSACDNVGTCSAGSNFTTQSMCQNAGSCTIAGNYSQSSCTNAGTCSLSSYTSQSSCAAAGTCNISGYNSQNSCTSNRAYMCSVGVGLTQTQCGNAGTCSLSAYSTESSCEAAYSGYVCKINNVTYNDSNHNTQAKCTNSANGVCSKTPASTYNTKSKCQQTPNAGTWYVGVWTGVPAVWTPATWSRQYGTWTAAPGTWTAGGWTSSPGTWTPGVWTVDRSQWAGCVKDRGDNSGPSTPAYDVNNATPNNSAASKFLADTSSCSTSMLALGYDWGVLSSKVDAMTAGGSTNQPIGLAWAWHSLSTGAPMNAPSLPTNTTRYIIILSDGENTADRWYGSGSTHSQSVDDRMELVCANAKADNIIIWSVFVNIAGTAGNADSMRKCATGYTAGMSGNPDHYIEVTSTGDIGTAFDVISQQITNLRVAH